MTDPASTPPLCEAAHETTEEEEACEERRLAGDGSPTGQDLPPYTGDAAVCAKCGYFLVSMEYQPPLSAHAMLRRNRRLIRGPLPERQLRTCDRCRYQWDESVGTAPEPLAPLTAEELAYALDNATPYPVELHPEVAAVTAANLLQMLDAHARPGHVVWDPEMEDARPRDVRPTPAEDAPPTPASVPEEVAGLEDLEPERAALVRAVHAAMRELEDAHAHYLVPGVAPHTGLTARRVLRATALRLRRGEDTETVLLNTVTALAHVLAGGDGITPHTLTGVDA